jgi:hypothetical protein
VCQNETHNIVENSPVALKLADSNGFGIAESIKLDCVRRESGLERPCKSGTIAVAGCRLLGAKINGLLYLC